MAIRNGNPNEALPYLRDAEAAGPIAFVGYLIQLFKGRALERLGRLARGDRRIPQGRRDHAGTDGAVRACCRARESRRSGRRRSPQAEAATRSTARSTDPWMAYGRGDGRMWRDIARQLREQIRGMP